MLGCDSPCADSSTRAGSPSPRFSHKYPLSSARRRTLLAALLWWSWRSGSPGPDETVSHDHLRNGSQVLRGLLGLPLDHWLWHVNTHLKRTCGPCLLTAELTAVWSSRRGGGVRPSCLHSSAADVVLDHPYLHPTAPISTSGFSACLTPVSLARVTVQSRCGRRMPKSKISERSARKEFGMANKTCFDLGARPHFECGGGGTCPAGSHGRTAAAVYSACCG